MLSKFYNTKYISSFYSMGNDILFSVDELVHIPNVLVLHNLLLGE
ncbi:Uncharacterised protein [Mycobacteroides abscessus subsp. abscessus]|nr:Uncharacterised protein [Mycobacteroides abscessus subsp. abscessus]